MRIIYNCTALEKWSGNATGIQRVVLELGREFEMVSDRVIPAVFLPDGRCTRFLFDGGLDESEEIAIEPGDLIFSADHDWDHPEQFSVIRKYVAKGVRFGVLFYDTMPINFPFTYTDEFNARFQSWLDDVLSMADVAFAISDCTRRDVENYAKKRGGWYPSISVMRLGDNLSVAKDDVPAELVEKAGKPFILAVGTVEFRKNYSVLLNAYRILIGEMGVRPPLLYIVGRQGLLDGGIREQAERDVHLKGLVEVLHDVTDSGLKILYDKAMFTVYPSIYEGWGLPVAESLCHGKQCITSRCTSMLEIAPALTRFAHPLCPDQWAEQIRQLCSDVQMLEAENRYIRENYRPVSWKDSASGVLHFLERAFPELQYGLRV